MRLKILLGILFVLLGGALGTGSPLLYRLAYILLAAVAVSRLWAWLSARGLQGKVSPHTQRPQVGQWLGESVTLHNRSRLPKLGLEISGESRRAVSLGPLGSATWEQHTLCRRRGPWERGRIALVGRDPLGLFAQTVALGQSQTILVYPRTEALHSFFLTSADVSGRGRSRRAREVTPRIWGIRDYYPGDSFSRIHWLTTARTGNLMVKEFEVELSSEVWVLLDLAEAIQAGQGLDNTEELGVVVAASLARRLGEADYALGFLAQGEQRYLTPPLKGSQHLWRIMEALACARAQGRLPLADLIAAEARRFSALSIVIAVTPSCDERLLAALSHLHRRGTRVLAVLLDTAGFGGKDDAPTSVRDLVTQGIETYLVRRGDDLSQVLDSRVEGLAKIRHLEKEPDEAKAAT